ncbi:MAG TPA: poly-gamma-glutamate hydrolase family protein [Syntrophomonadaceae bacterium]|nr:poly-gamma-glutamate hydrolase family protein [Syntrophomonadaceae bacterium]
MIRNIRVVLSSFIISLLSMAVWAGPAWADTYGNFSALKAHNKANVDYKIVSQDTSSSTAVIAIHGGNIERETTEVASAVANLGGLDFYSFEGIKANSTSLHITATHFNEPTARSLVAKSSKTLSIHGCYGTSQALTNLGGLDKALGKKIQSNLQTAGFKVVRSPGNIGGTASGNICNRNTIHKGVQLELSVPLRNQLAKNSKDLDRYVAALGAALK